MLDHEIVTLARVVAKEKGFGVRNLYGAGAIIRQFDRNGGRPAPYSTPRRHDFYVPLTANRQPIRASSIPAMGAEVHKAYRKVNARIDLG